MSAAASRTGSLPRRSAIPALIAGIIPTAPFAFDLALRYLETSPSAVTEVIADGAYHRAVRLGDRPAVVRVTAARERDLTPWPPSLQGKGEDALDLTPGPFSLQGRGEGTARWGAPMTRQGVTLRVEVDGVGLGGEHLAAGMRLVEGVFGTRADVGDIERDVAADPIFLAVAQRFRGLRPVLIADPFEALVWAIIGQQINVRFAAKLKRALVERFGARIPAHGGEFLLFPDPEALAGLEHERDLRPLQFSRQKSEYTILVAREIASGRLDLEALRTAPPEEALARLMALKGIGRWTAEYMLLRGFGNPDSIPAADGGLKRVIGRDYGLGRLATEAEVRDIAARWAGWRGYAAFYWWFTLQLEAEARASGEPPRRQGRQARQDS